MKNRKAVMDGWAFIRVSTADQGNVQHGSLEQQKNMIDRWAKQRSESPDVLYRIVRYINEDGKSGRGKNLHNRPELQELKNAIRMNKIDFVVVEKLDRLSRDQVFNIEIVKLAQEFGVEVHEYETGLIDLKDRGKRLGFNIKNMMAEEYSMELEEKITKKQREAMINNGKDTSSKPVLGLDQHPTKSCFYVINTEEQLIVMDVFKRFAEVGSVKAVVEYCLQRGYRTKSRMLKQKIDKDGNIRQANMVGGLAFDAKTLRSLLSCRKLNGRSSFKDTWNQFPRLQDSNGVVRWEYAHFRQEGPVVPDELWDRVQNLLETNKRKNSRARSATVYLLSGILYKSNGKKLVGASAKSGANHYYEDRGEGEFRISKLEIEKIICDRVRSFLNDSGLLKAVLKNGHSNHDRHVLDVQAKLVGNAKKVKDLEQAKTAFSAQLRKAAIERPDSFNGVVELIGAESARVEAELANLYREKSRLEDDERNLASAFQEENIRVLLEKALKDFDRRCDREKLQIIQAIIPKIVVHHDRLELHFNFLGDSGKDRKPGGQKFDLVKNGSLTERYIEYGLSKIPALMSMVSISSMQPRNPGNISSVPRHQLGTVPRISRLFEATPCCITPKISFD